MRQHQFSFTMKKLLFFLNLLVFYSGYSQNLVPNPSFEQYVACPASAGELPEPGLPSISVVDWYKATYGTSDYFNDCSTSPTVSVPQNFFGWQYPRTGRAYAGEYLANIGSGQREYIQSRLSIPLIAGHQYYVSFWVNLADNSPFALHQIGAYLGSAYVYDASAWQLDNLLPQVVNQPGNFITDTAKWRLVHGAFTASGGEQYIVIGNFASAANLETLPSNSSGLCYYYVDDVCVTDISGTTFSHDTIMCSTEESMVLHAPVQGGPYVWNTGDTLADLQITQPGTYWVLSPEECTARIDTFHVSLYVTPSPGDLDTTLCVGTGEVKIDIPAGHPRWYFAGQAGSKDSFIVNTNQAGYQEALVTQTINGCESAPSTVTVKVLDRPVATLTDTLLCHGDEITLGAPQPDVSFRWSTGDNTCCITVNEPGQYSLDVTNYCGIASDTALINFTNCHMCLWLPNAFSPNSDGLNDNLALEVHCPFKKFRFRIFNRWGQLVFASDNPQSSWNGKFKGMDCDAGTYFYWLEGEAEIGENRLIKIKGDVTLIR